MLVIYGESLIPPLTTLELDDHPSSVVCDYVVYFDLQFISGDRLSSSSKGITERAF